MNTQNQTPEQDSETEPLEIPVNKVHLGKLLYEDPYVYYWDPDLEIRIRCDSLDEEEAVNVLNAIITNGGNDFIQITLHNENVIIVWEDYDGVNCYHFPRKMLTLKMLNAIVEKGEE